MLVPEAFAFGGVNVPTTAIDTYSEQLVLVPGMYVGHPYGEAPGGAIGNARNTDLFEDTTEFAATFMVPEDANIYVLPCSSPHISPQLDSALKGILQADEKAFLLIGARERTLLEREYPEHMLFSDDVIQHGYPVVWSERLKTRMRKNIEGELSGVGWNRVRFLDALDADVYAAVLSTAKVVLDSFPHSNIVPSLEAM